MPELPEVETVRSDLAEVLPGDSIVSIDVLLPKMLRIPLGDDLHQQVVGQQIRNVRRRAKLIILELDNDRYLIMHLKMTGQLFWQGADEHQLIAGGHTLSKDELPSGHPNKYTHVIFHLKSGAVLLFNDMRQFGYVELADDDRIRQIDNTYGPEPLTADFTWEAFYGAISRRPRSVLKAALLDQKVLAGLGNIYVDEACFRAGIRPQTRVGDISRRRLKELWRVIPMLLDEAVQLRGTTFNSYRDGRGRRGSFVSKLAVYGRADEPCLKCGTQIEKTRVAGRGTHFCPRCQPK